MKTAVIYTCHLEGRYRNRRKLYGLRNYKASTIAYETAIIQGLPTKAMGYGFVFVNYNFRAKNKRYDKVLIGAFRICRL